MSAGRNASQHSENASNTGRTITPKTTPSGLAPRENAVLRLQRMIGNQATQALLQRNAPVGIQRYVQIKKHGGASVTAGGNIMWKGKHDLFATPAMIESAQEKLVIAGSFIKLSVSETDKTIYDVEGVQMRRVDLSMNDALMPRSRGYTSVRGKNDEAADGEYCSFADCERTAETVMGSNIDRRQTQQPVVSGEKVKPLNATNKGEYGKSSIATANLGMNAVMLKIIPEFLPIANDVPVDERVTPANWTTLIEKLELAIADGVPSQQLQKLERVYRDNIMKDPQIAKLFAQTYQVNEYAVPEIGGALTQVNDELEHKNESDKPEGTEGKKDMWNFHWAGVIMMDGSDYITLENTAQNIEDLELDDPQRNLTSKREIINKLWYFGIYGTEEQSFHARNKAEDSHVGESPMTLGYRK